MSQPVPLLELHTSLKDALNDAKGRDPELQQWPDMYVDQLAYDLAKQLLRLYVMHELPATNGPTELPRAAQDVVENCLKSARKRHDSHLTRTSSRKLVRRVNSMLAQRFSLELHKAESP